MQEMIVIGWRISKKDPQSRLGIVDAIRDAAKSIKARNPHLKDSSLKDVTLKRFGDEIRLTFYFMQSS